MLPTAPGYPITKCTIALLAILLGASGTSATTKSDVQRAADVPDVQGAADVPDVQCAADVPDVQYASEVRESNSDEVLLLANRRELASAQPRRVYRGDGAYHLPSSNAQQATPWASFHGDVRLSLLLSGSGTAQSGITISSWALSLLCCFLPMYLAYVKVSRNEASMSRNGDSFLEEEQATNNFRSYRWTLLITLCVAYILDMSSQAALTASFGQLEKDVGLSPDKQGILMMLQNGALASSSILWAVVADGAAGDLFVLGLGCAIASLASLATAFTAQYGWGSLAAVRFAYGFGAGAIRPIVQAIVSDCFAKHELGSAFACLMAASSIGLFVSTPLVASISVLRVSIRGVILHGWQISFTFIGIVSALYALLVFMLAFCSGYTRHKKRQGPKKGLASALQIPSCWLLVLVCACLRTVVETHVLLVEWAEYFTNSSFLAGSYVSVGLISCAIGSVLGGLLADRWADAYPQSGRISLGQVGTILTAISWIGLVHSRQVGALTFLWFFTLGFTKMWGYVGTGKPLIMQLVSSEVRASFIATSELIEGILAALAGPFLVGLLAEHVFEYKPKTVDVFHMSPEYKLNNLHSLGQALTCVNLVCLGAASLVLAGLYTTYPTDLEAVARSED